MNQLRKIKKEICLGRLVWIQPPTKGSSVFFAKKILNGLGVEDRDMIFLTATQFIRYSTSGFSPEFLTSKRIILIGELEGLSEKDKSYLQAKLSLHKMLKHRFDVSLVLVAPSCSNVDQWVHRQLKVSPVSLFAGSHPIGINEKIHDLIEIASVQYRKPVWSLSEEAARLLEEVFLKNGEDYLKKLIFRAVRASESKVMNKKDLDAARCFMILFKPSAKEIQKSIFSED